MSGVVEGFCELAALPRVPNFLYLSDGTVRLISEVPEPALREFGRRYTEALVERSREIREGFSVFDESRLEAAPTKDGATEG